MGRGSEKRSKRSKDKELPQHKLLKYSVKGRSSKLRKWLKRDRSLACAVLADGSTPLHQACRHGHVKVVKQLLKYGANAEQVDAYGCTPGHVAALYGYADLLATLLQSPNPPDVDQPDQTGVTIRDLVQATNSSTPLLQYLTSKAAPAPAAAAAGGGANRLAAPRRGQRSYHSDADSGSSGGGGGRGTEAAWRAKLRDEMSDEDVGGIGWARHRPVLDEEDASAYNFPGLHLGRDDAWAEQLWREMLQRRARSSSQPLFGAGAQAARQAAAERDRRAAEAAAASAKILLDELAKDADWRARMLAQVQQGKALQSYAAYQAKWASLEQLPSTQRLPLPAFPWPITPIDQLSPEGLKQLLLQGCGSAVEIKKRLKLELMRWHPDKFSAKYAGRVVDKDKAAVLEGVQQVAQCLTALLGAAQQ